MKKLKFILIFLLTFSLTGCLDVSLDLTLKNDDSGTIKYVAACQKEYCASITKDSPMIKEDDFKGIKDVTTKDVTFKKNNVEYQGKEVSIPFKSLQEFNEIMDRINEDEEDTEEETKTIDQFIVAKRDGSKVSLTLQGDPEGYAEMAPTIPMINYSLTIKVEGKVLTQNADNYNEKEKTLTWNITTMLKDGIKLEYETSTGLLTPLNMVIGVVALIAIATVIGLLATRKSKKEVTPTPVEPATETVIQDVVEPITPTVEPVVETVVEFTEQQVQPTEETTTEVLESPTTPDSNDDQISQ